MKIKRSHIRIKIFAVVLLILSFSGLLYSSEIFFHEEFIDKDGDFIHNMHSVNDDGSMPINIGYGAMPKLSPNKKYLSFIKATPEYSGQPSFSQMIIMDGRNDRKNITDTKGNIISETDIIFRGEEYLGEKIIRYCWHPNSESLAYAMVEGPNRRDGFIYIFNIKTGKTTKIYNFKYNMYTDAIWATTLEWSPDGKYLLFYTTTSEKKRNGIYIIDPETKLVRLVSEDGALPRFVDNNRIVFIVKSSIWIIDIRSNEKTEIIDTKLKIIDLSNVIGEKLVIQVFPEIDTPTLHLFDFGDNTVKVLQFEEHIFFCPKLSPDGNKMTVIGKLKNRTTTAGFYIYDFKLKKITLLKKLMTEGSKGFWYGVYFGYGNNSSWN